MMQIKSTLNLRKWICFSFLLFFAFSGYTQNDNQFPFKSGVFYLDTAAARYYYYNGVNAYNYNYYGEYEQVNDSSICLKPNVLSFLSFVNKHGTRTKFPVFTSLEAFYSINGDKISFQKKIRDTLIFLPDEKKQVDSLIKNCGVKMNYEIKGEEKKINSPLAGVVVDIRKQNRKYEVYICTGNVFLIYSGLKKVSLKKKDFIDSNQLIGFSSKRSRCILQVYRNASYYKFTESITLDGTKIQYVNLM
ncbi:MAG: hypothetical protein IT221_04140 [Fluviicola sp.]|nr:hypothetical protein [Fluviicola sp.]